MSTYVMHWVFRVQLLPTLLGFTVYRIPSQQMSTTNASILLTDSTDSRFG